MNTYSVAFRLQRITTECAYISVPITDDLFIEREDGTRKLDVEKIAQRAIEIGQDREVEWLEEEQSIQLHPVQQARP